MIHALQCSLQHYLQQPDMEATCVQHRWMVKEDAVYLHDEILLSHKNNEILSFGTTWLNLEGIMLSETDQTDKDKYCMISFICEI